MLKAISKQKKIVGVAPQGDPHSIKTTPEYVGAGLVPAHNKNNNGITLVALIITIIIMLILVGVTVTVALNGGLFNTAKKAVDETEILQEKEVIERAFILAQMGNGVQEARFRTCLEDEAGADNIELSAFGDEFEVYFKKSKRYYPVDKYGEIGDYEIVVEITNAGDITKGNTLDGVDKPYEINCIEDLLALSYKTNGIKAEIDGTLGTDTSTSYSGKQIILKRDLNFKSKYSYENADRTDYGDVNGNGTVESLITELTTGKGWIPISSYASNSFTGIFDGNKKTIKNIYMYNEEALSKIGMFGWFTTGTIKNLKLTGTIYCNSDYVGGIVGFVGTKTENQIIENCSFEGKIENVNTSGRTGGIVGNSTGGTTNISNCYFKGELIGSSATGGIIGYSNGYSKIENSHNEATIKGEAGVGGIIGTSQGTSEVYKCYNTGMIRGKSSVGGIVGYRAHIIEKCYNTGSVIGTDSPVAGIAAQIYAGNDKKISQCYNTGEITGAKDVAGILAKINGANNKILNCYNTGKINGTTIAGIVISNESTKIVSCYNRGELKANTKYGVSNDGVYSGITSNSYYLDSCGATDTLATAKSETDLKGMYGTLDKAFTIDDEANTVTISETENQNVWVQDTGNKNKGYPILKWQIEQ